MLQKNFQENMQLLSAFPLNLIFRECAQKQFYIVLLVTDCSTKQGTPDITRKRRELEKGIRPPKEIVNEAAVETVNRKRKFQKQKWF